jgi:hypothetical protein
MLRSPERFTLLQILSASLFLQKNGTPKGIGLAIARLGFAVNPAEREGDASLPGAFHAPSNPFGVPFFYKKNGTPKGI